jgi:hypothetical protein
MLLLLVGRFALFEPFGLQEKEKKSVQFSDYSDRAYFHLGLQTRSLHYSRCKTCGPKKKVIAQGPLSILFLLVVGKLVCSPLQEV